MVHAPTNTALLSSLGERKDFEVYSCDVSPDGSRLVTAAGGELGRISRNLSDRVLAVVFASMRCVIFFTCAVTIRTTKVM